MKRLKERKKTLKAEDEFETPVQNAAQISTEETMKELALQKEDSKMKKVIAQMMLMKQIQKKKEENRKLGMALKKLAERRKIINAALKRQKQIADEKRRLALVELERQKNLMAEKEQLIFRLKKEKEIDQRKKEGNLRQKQRLQQNLPKSERSQNEQISQKAKMLEAHKLLVDKSNDRILARIEEIKLERQKEAIAEQEKLLKEQQTAINVLRSVQKQRLRKQNDSNRSRPAKQNNYVCREEIKTDKNIPALKF